MKTVVLSTCISFTAHRTSHTIRHNIWRPPAEHSLSGHHSLIVRTFIKRAKTSAEESSDFFDMKSLIWIELTLATPVRLGWWQDGWNWHSSHHLFPLFMLSSGLKRKIKLWSWIPLPTTSNNPSPLEYGWITIKLLLSVGAPRRYKNSNTE